MTDQKKIYEAIVTALSDLAIPTNIPILQKFFKTGKGAYGEGDIFIGVKVPEQRQVAKEFYKVITLPTIKKLLTDAIHEYRLTAVIMLTIQFSKCKTLAEKKNIVDFYLEHRNYINNWDIVDSSTHKILGPYVAITKEFEILYNLAAEESIWSKRIAVVAFWHLFKEGFIEQGLTIIAKNLTHTHDLMHKANGWMLRELANKNEQAMLEFLSANYAKIPRTTLRYAIEKLDRDKRLAILKDGNFD